MQRSLKNLKTKANKAYLEHLILLFKTAVLNHFRELSSPLNLDSIKDCPTCFSEPFLDFF